MIVCAGLIGGAVLNTAAQTGNKVLVAGKKTLKQADVNNLIDFYQWAFETEFSDEERGRFQKYTVAEFRNDPDSSRNTIDDIVNTFPRLIAADNAVQKETRKNFLAVFLPEARKNSDENSQMLLGIYEAAHGGGNKNSNYASRNSDDDSNDASDDSNDESAGGGDLSDLTGKWAWSRTGGTTWSNNGVYAGGNGSRFTYEFAANGAVKFTGAMNVMQGGCSQQIFRLIEGRASLSGDTLTIRWSPEKFTRDFSCDRANNYTKTRPARTEVDKVRFKTDSTGQKQLCLTGKEETCFSPAR